MVCQQIVNYVMLQVHSVSLLRFDNTEKKYGTISVHLKALNMLRTMW